MRMCDCYLLLPLNLCFVIYIRGIGITPTQEVA